MHRVDTVLTYIILTGREFAEINRGIEWSLRALASTRALRLFLRAREVIKFVLRAASSLENTTANSEHFDKLSANFTRRLIRVYLVP